MVIMLSRQNSHSSLGASIRALFLVEDLDKRPTGPLNPGRVKPPQKNPLTGTCVERGLIWQGGSIEDVLKSNEGNEKGLMDTSRGDLFLGDAGNRNSVSVSEGQDTASTSETLPDVSEGDTIRDRIPEPEAHEDSFCEGGTVETSMVDDEGHEIIPLKRECCPFGTFPCLAEGFFSR